MSLRIIISPAKKMNEDVDSLAWRDLPVFLPETEKILAQLHEMTAGELKSLWKCNDKIAALNIERLESMDLRSKLTPAILAYEGIQYQYMSPGVFSDGEYDYIQQRLRILSGFYGALRPFDGVTPYRLEMQAKLAMGEKKDLYAFWGDSIAKNVIEGADCIVNLASKEYSVCVSKYAGGMPFITCTFGEEKDGKIIEKGTMCKMARGEMVRFMAENRIDSPEGMKDFSRLGYRFDEGRSDARNYVFKRG